MKAYWIGLLLLFSISGWAQESKDIEKILLTVDSIYNVDPRNPFAHKYYYRFKYYEDYDLVLKLTQNEGSKYHKDSIISKFKQDQINTPSEKLCLLVISGRQPNRESPKLLRNYKKIEKAIESDAWLKVKKLATKNLAIFEFDIKSLGYLFEYYNKQKNKDEASQYMGKVYQLLSTTQYTGGAGDKQRPYLIIKEQDLEEYFAKYALGVPFKILEKKKDEFGNQLIICQVMGKPDSFIIPQ